MTELQATTSLLTLKNGHSGRICSIDGGKQTVRRMLALGLRVGTIVNMLNHRGKSVVFKMLEPALPWAPAWQKCC